MSTDTFLGICQEVFDKLLFQGSFNTVDVNRTDYRYKIVDAVSTGWRDLQNSRPDLWFLKTRITHTVTAGTQDYDTYGGSNDIFTSAQFDRFGHWWPEEFRYIVSGSGASYPRLRYVPYDQWLAQDRTEAVTTPTIFSIDYADNSVHFQNLSATATVRLEYQKSAQILSSDTDVPECPLNVREVIMWYGLWRAAVSFGNSDKIAEGQHNFELTKGALFRQQIPGRRVTTPSIA